ncbi:MAG: hypothetical protein JKX69_03815 [Rhodobacteraceae bacterium]|nr:hypothetical protein [Paracoccaceae bacterium]PHR55901.1 MAG: hypothetical protein COA47_13480 [Robiginitomaculum sp.]
MTNAYVYRSETPARLVKTDDLVESAKDQIALNLAVISLGDPVDVDEIKKSPDDAVARLLGELAQVRAIADKGVAAAAVKVSLPLPGPMRLDPMLLSGLMCNLVNQGATILELDGSAYGLNAELDAADDGFTLMGLPKPEGFRLAINMGALSNWSADRLAEIAEELAADRYIFAINAGDDVSALAKLPEDSIAVLGLIDPAGGQSNDDILDLIDVAAEVLDQERLALTVRDGFDAVHADSQQKVLYQLAEVSDIFWGLAV